MALAFNLATVPLKFVAIPLLTGLAAGTGALGAYVTAPAPTATAAAVAALPSTSTAPVAAEQATPARPDAKPSCEKQTWPYLDNRCVTRSDPARKVRLVMAPRNGDAVPSAALPALVTSDTVLRGPGVAPEVNEQQPAKKPKRSEKRQQNRDDFRRVYSVYSVPARGGDKPVIVVRPLPLNAYSSRF